MGVNALGIRSPSPHDISLIPTITHPESEQENEIVGEPEPHDPPTAGRQRVRKWLNAAANKMGNAAHEKLDVSDYNDQVSNRPLRAVSLC